MKIDLNKLMPPLGLGYALLDPAWQIVECEMDVIPETGREAITGESIGSAFPELVGYEPILQQVSDGELPRFKMENLNREGPKGNLVYFNLEVVPTEEPVTPLVVVLSDVTSLAQLRQHIRQQQYEMQLLNRQKSGLRGDSETLLGYSEQIVALRNLIEKLSGIPRVTVLIQGESGTGKSLVARMLHGEQKSPFVEISCASIPENLLESELFGYEKGAFTNATTTKSGIMETANGGTLFLDEIGELPLGLQAKLLTFIETKKFRRLGSTVEKHVDLRLVTATNRNLEAMISEGKFRQDLFYRLNVVRLVVPPLRQLGEDVLLLARHFICHYNLEFNKQIEDIDESAREFLRRNSWPGNVRELRNTIERAMIFCSNRVLTAKDLNRMQSEQEAANTRPRFDIPAEGMPFAQIEKEILITALQMANHNQSRAARLLHLRRDALRYRLKKHGLLSEENDLQEQ